MIGKIDIPSPDRMPAPGSNSPTFSGEVGKIRYAPKPHECALRENAVLDLMQHLFNDTRSGFAGEECNGRVTVEAIFRFA